jgi:trichothecene 3-O-acetyltransferase
MANYHDVLLSPLDQLMPRCYTRLFLLFGSPTPDLAISSFKMGWEKTCTQLSYLKGYVYQAENQRGRLAIAWSDDSPVPVISEKGHLKLSYETVLLHGTSFSAFKDDLCPVRAVIDHSTSDRKAPVLAASVGELEGGIIICVAAHHNVMDGTGFGDLIDLIARNTNGNLAASATLPHPDEPLYRTARLRHVLEAGKTFQNQGMDTDIKLLLTNHLEYTTTPPSMPSQSPPCTSKLLTVSLPKVEAIKQALKGSMPSLTTYTVVSSLLWSCITRVRCARAGGCKSPKSRLGMAVNGRQRLGASFTDQKYLGNVNMYAIAELATNTITSSAATRDVAGTRIPNDLIGVFQAVAESISSDRISSRHIMEVMTIIDQLEDVRGLFPGWNFHDGPDLAITSWANLNVYDADFGEKLGRPALVRVPYAEVDGLCIILPRRRHQHGRSGENVIEVVVMLRADDLAQLQEDEVWKTWVV